MPNKFLSYVTPRYITTEQCHAFLPRFDPMGVFCNAKPVLAPRGLAAPNVVDKAGVLPKRLPLVVHDAPKVPTSYSDFIIVKQLPTSNITIQF